VALTSLSVAGNLDSRNLAGLTSLTFASGSVGTITVGRAVGATNTVNINAAGPITSIQAASWLHASTVNASSVGTFTVTGSKILLGNFIGNITLQGPAGSTGNTLGTFKVANDVENSSITVLNGGIGAFTVGYSIEDLSINVLAGGLNSLSAAEWIEGSLTARGVGTLTTTGLGLPNASGDFIAGDLALVSMSLYRNSGTGLAIATLNVAGSLTLGNGFIRADNGIGTFTVGRDVGGAANSIIHVDNPSASIATMSAGRWGALGGVDISTSSIGTVSINGFQAPENGTATFHRGDFDSSTVFVSSQSSPPATGTNSTPHPPAGITSFTTNGDLSNAILNVRFGITTLKVAGTLNNSTLQIENPLSASSGRIGSLTAGAVDDSSIQANAIGTLKTVGSAAFGLAGHFDGTDVTTTVLSGAALGTLSVVGNMNFSTMNIRGSVTTFTVTLTLLDDQIAAGFNGANQIGALTAGSIQSLDLVTNSLITLTVSGNTAVGLAGSIRDSLFTITGKVPSVTITTSTGSGTGSGSTKVTYNNVGLGTVTVTGTVTNTDFNVFSGNVVSVTVGAFTSSDLLVGFHAVAANDLNTPVGPQTADWNAANFQLISFKTAQPLVSPALAPTFTDSLVVAAKLGTITLPGINPIAPPIEDTIAFGVGFRNSTGGKGTVTIEGTLRSPGFTKPGTNTVFVYRGLAG
jgi:hypothetical protein